MCRINSARDFVRNACGGLSMPVYVCFCEHLRFRLLTYVHICSIGMNVRNFCGQFDQISAYVDEDVSSNMIFSN